MARLRTRLHRSLPPREGAPTARTPLSYRACNLLTEIILYVMVVFTPWAFGATEDWAVWTMNIAGYALGLLLLSKWVIRRVTGYQPKRWTDPVGSDDLEPSVLGGGPAAGSFQVEIMDRQTSAAHQVTRALAVLTLLFLVYCFGSALNARATYLGWHLFDYHECIRWLPHSYDSKASWFSSWTYLGLAFVFWATRDWLLEKTARDRHRSKSLPETSRSPEPELISAAESRISSAARARIPARLQRLLWVICVNGAVLGLEAILQRLDGTSKLLWLVEPTRNRTAEAQFGPYAYRANAASYFNLVWPLCLGFWTMLRQKSRSFIRGGGRVGEGNHLVLLPGAVLMAGCPIIATTRGGAIIAALNLVLATVVLLFAGRKGPRWDRLGIVALVIVILAFAGALGWEDLSRRFATVFSDDMSRRPEIYANAKQIARDFPLFGTGPGSFGAMYQMYRQTEQNWAGYAHDDWLESLIDFGWLGFGVVLLMLTLAVARWFLPGGIWLGWEFTLLAWIALGGCLLHAKFDFPFQIYSILFLFVLVCSILFSGTQRAANSA